MNTDRCGLPATLDFDKVFATVFWALTEERDFMLTDIADDAGDDDYSPSDVRERLDEDIEWALSALGVQPPAGDSLEWKGHLHDLILATAPRLDAYLERTTDQD